MAGPAVLRSSGAMLPSVASSADTEPFLPSAATRTASSAASSAAAAMAAAEFGAQAGDIVGQAHDESLSLGEGKQKALRHPRMGRRKA